MTIAETSEQPIFHLIVLALVQGISEFLPISSSAHLILVPALTGWADQGLAIDVATHVGTLLAVMVYFRADVARLVRGGFGLLKGRVDGDSRLALQVVAATVPVVIVGFVLKDHISTDWRSPAVIAVTTGLFGVVLWQADRGADDAGRGMDDLSWRDVIIIGLAQAMALVPGVSRSGITMTAALFLGLRRPEAARFSMLMSIPTIVAAGVLAGADLARSGEAAALHDALFVGGLAFISAIGAIWALMAWLKSASFRPFVYYRLILAAVLAALLGSGVLAA